MKKTILLATMTCSLAFASEVRFYPNFVEVRTPIEASEQHTIKFESELYNQIIADSLTLEGLSVLDQRSTYQSQSLDGQTVFVHRGSEIIEAEVVRASEMLLKDKKTGRYFRADPSQVEYTTLPETPSTLVEFNLARAGKGTLSYWLNGVSWQPRYTLSLTDTASDFIAWADFNNTTSQKMSIDKAELIAGEVNVQTYRAEAMYDAMPVAKGMAAMSASAPVIQNSGEMSGLYVYTISTPFTLNARSKYSLPFIQPKVTVERKVGVTTWFYGGNAKGKLSRMYDFSASEFLPRGTVTVRENNRIVGQTSLGDLAQNEKITLNLGLDPDISYDRQVKVLSSDKKGASYQITLTLKNAKDKATKLEYKEMYNNKFSINTQDKLPKVLENGMEIGTTLKANSNAVVKYTVNLTY